MPILLSKAHRTVSATHSNTRNGYILLHLLGTRSALTGPPRNSPIGWRDAASTAARGCRGSYARYRWQVKAQRNIVVHNSVPLLDRCAASAIGIMPHIHVSGYFRLTVPVDEVIE